MTLLESDTAVLHTQAVRSPEIDIASTRPGTPGGIFTRQFWIALLFLRLGPYPYPAPRRESAPGEPSGRSAVSPH